MSELHAESSDTPESSSVGGLSIKDEDFEGLFGDFNESSSDQITGDSDGDSDEGDVSGSAHVKSASNEGKRPEMNGIEGEKDIGYWRTTSMGRMQGGECCVGSDDGQWNVKIVRDGDLGSRCRTDGEVNVECRPVGWNGRERKENEAGCGVDGGKRGAGSGMPGSVQDVKRMKACSGEEDKASVHVDARDQEVSNTGNESSVGASPGIQDETVHQFTDRHVGGDTVHSSMSTRKRCGETEMDEGGVDGKRFRTDVVDTMASSLCPPHPGFMYELCVRCGAEKSDNDQSESLKMSYVHHGLELSKEEVDRIAKDNASTLASEQKLNLVLDLDLTLLNTCPMSELSLEHQRVCENWLEIEAGSGKQPTLYCLPHAGIWTKLRPFVFDFLKALQPKFHLHIYTMGDRAYAADMAKILDPTGKLFGNRVISRNDSASEGVKNLDVVLGSSDSTLIVDDTEAVWPEHRANLLKIDRYLFFPFTARQYNRPSRLLESGRDECPDGGQLDVILKVLLLIHSHAFENTNSDHCVQDVRIMLRSIRGRILKGCTILFKEGSGQDPGDYQRNRAKCLAEDMGAVVAPELSSNVTHMIALKGFDKGADEMVIKCSVVTYSWLEHCSVAWQRVGAHLHPAIL